MEGAPTVRIAISAALLLALCPLAPAHGREALGVYGGWGAFRDESPARCFAVAEPPAGLRDAEWRPFATIASWPGRGLRGQLYIRLRHAGQAGEPITLEIGERRFRLVGSGANAWAPDPRTDAAIVAAMRSGSSMSVSTRAASGRPFADVYGLRGAATAIDAAALGCVPRR